MTAPLIRILLRYVAGLLVARGLISTDMGSTLASDPDVLDVLSLVIGTAAGLAAEWWYVLARRFGWAK